MMSPIGFLLALVFVGLGVSVYRVLDDNNFFLEIKEHGNQHCKKYTGLEGAEDMDLTSDGFLFIGSDNRTWFPRGVLGGNATELMIHMDKLEQVHGFYVIDLNLPLDERYPYKLEIDNWPDSIHDVHPHGLSIRESTSSSHDRHVYLYSVMHSRIGDLVAIFDVRFSGEMGDHKGHRIPTSLHYITHVNDKRYMNALNDVVGFPLFDSTGNTIENAHGFYTTNWLRSTLGSPWNALEYILKSEGANAITCSVYLDSNNKYTNQCKIVVDNILPNGVHMNNEYNQLYLVDYVARSVRVYNHKTIHIRDDLYMGELSSKPIQMVSMPTRTALDNVVYGKDGHLYIGAHPKPLDFILHKDNWDHVAPSQVWRVKREGDKWGRPQEIFLSKGGDLSASSVGLVHNGKLYVGAVFQDGVLECDFNENNEK